MDFCNVFLQFPEIALFGSVYGNFAEIFQVLHEVQGSFAGASASSLVTFDHLCLCVQFELGEFGIDFFNKLFHVTINLFWFVKC